MQRSKPTKFRVLATLLLLLIQFTWTVPTTQAEPASLRTERYIIPLVKNFGIERIGVENQVDDHNRFKLVEFHSRLTWIGHIPSVTKVAVHGEVIVGETTDSLFIFDTANPEPVPELYKTRQSWQSELMARSIPKDISLNTPDMLPDVLPNRALKPWEYRVMDGWLGQSDVEWGGFTIITGWFVAFVAGWYLNRNRSILLISIAIGSFTNGIGRIILEQGSSAGVGLFFEPVVCCVMMAFGRGIRAAFGPRRPPLNTPPVGSASADGISPS